MADALGGLRLEEPRSLYRASLKRAMLYAMAYHGGKGNCRARIVGAMPLHDIYIETHLGGGAVMRHKRPARRQVGVDADEAVIRAWSALVPAPCELVHGDAVEFLRAFPFKGDELVYSDPPYPRELRCSGNRYRRDYDDGDHERLLDTLLALSCRILVSGGPSPLYLDRLKDWRLVEFSAGARRGGRRELLWANFAPPLKLHDPRCAGSGFRDREAIKRRLATMARKVDRMDPVERAMFADWFARAYPGHLRSDAEVEAA